MAKPDGTTGQGPGWRARTSVLLSLAGGMSCSCDCENRCCWCETETVRYHRCLTVSSLGEGKRCVGEHAPLGWHISAVPSRRLEWEAARPWASRAGSRRCDCVIQNASAGINRTFIPCLEPSCNHLFIKQIFMKEMHWGEQNQT